MSESEEPKGDLSPAGDVAPKQETHLVDAPPGGEDEAASEAAPKPARTFSKTPLFTASNAARYQRQAIIKDLEQRTGRTLLCFVGGNEAPIHRDDTVAFMDLVHNVVAGERIDLMLHTVGGDIDVAEKLITLARAKVGEGGDIRVIVPDFAKSAGTLMALGANSILMSDSSELGAIDPQFYLKDANGNEICHSVLRYLAAFRDHADALKKNRDDPVALLMMDKFDPSLVQKFQGIRDRARDLAENLLKRRGKHFSKIASELMNIDIWKSHNQMIGAQDAKSLGLDVEVIAPEDPVWQGVWQLHCLLRLAITPRQKIYESSYVSLPI
ncbi:MAG: hypothetical protein ABUS57_02775 [Pseudomonadota bacterium]